MHSTNDSRRHRAQRGGRVIVLTAMAAAATMLVVRMSIDTDPRSYVLRVADPPPPPMHREAPHVANRIAGTTPPLPRRRLLTIVIDDSSSSGPEKSAFLHWYLPTYIRWRYVEIACRDIAKTTLDTDVLIVTWHPEEWVQWAIQHRARGLSAGLMHTADEKNKLGRASFHAFDYVLRHYWFDVLGLRALGNLSCGTGPAFEPDPRGRLQQEEPWLGAHWIMLQGLERNIASGHAPGTHWPASRRPRPCTWIGSIRADRHEMIDVMRREFPGCDTQTEDKFQGTVGHVRYSQMRLTDAVFGLNPWGNHPETHRLPEILDQGTIPVMRRASFLTSLFEPMPGVIEESWEDAARAMKALLAGDSGQLDALQDRCTQWYDTLQSCISQDLDLMLRLAMNVD